MRRDSCPRGEPAPAPYTLPHRPCPPHLRGPTRRNPPRRSPPEMPYCPHRVRRSQRKRAARACPKCAGRPPAGTGRIVEPKRTSGGDMAALSFLVWGSGFFGRKWLEALKARDDCRIAGIVSRSPEALDPLRHELGLPGVRGFRSLGAALGSAGADAVVVALPEALHRDAIVEALGAGLHVLTEKPLATSAAEARAIHQAAPTRPHPAVLAGHAYRRL